MKKHDIWNTIIIPALNKSHSNSTKSCFSPSMKESELNHFAEKIRKSVRIRYDRAASRCNNSNDSNFKSYGGRNIKLKFSGYVDYLREIATLENFCDILELDVDRINNNSDYMKGNLRLSSRKDNCNNRRTTIYTSDNVPLAECLEKSNISRPTALKLIKSGMSSGEIETHEPVQFLQIKTKDKRIKKLINEGRLIGDKDKGLIFDAVRNMPIKPMKDSDGERLRVKIYVNGNSLEASHHRILALMFLKPLANVPLEKQSVDHINPELTWVNRIDNLRWATAKKQANNRKVKLSRESCEKNKEYYDMYLSDKTYDTFKLKGIHKNSTENLRDFKSNSIGIKYPEIAKCIAIPTEDWLKKEAKKYKNAKFNTTGTISIAANSHTRCFFNCSECNEPIMRSRVLKDVVINASRNKSGKYLMCDNCLTKDRRQNFL